MIDSLLFLYNKIYTNLWRKYSLIYFQKLDREDLSFLSKTPIKRDKEREREKFWDKERHWETKRDIERQKETKRDKER